MSWPITLPRFFPVSFSFSYYIEETAHTEHQPNLDKRKLPDKAFFLFLSLLDRIADPYWSLTDSPNSEFLDKIVLAVPERAALVPRF